jgi:hypothetical protein
VNVRVLAIAMLGSVMFGVMAGCDEPRKETTWERITRFRLHYKVSPNWFEMQTGKDGKRVLVMDLTVNNIGKESIKQVTMVLHVLGSDGKDRVKMPLTLDTSEVVPGVPGKVTVKVLDVEVKWGEEVVLQMEGQPTKAEMAAYPEYKPGVN